MIFLKEQGDKRDSHAHLHIQSSSMWSTGDITGVEGWRHTRSGCRQTHLSRGAPSVHLKVKQKVSDFTRKEFAICCISHD